MTRILLLSLAVPALAGNVFFRHGCDTLVTERLDPIVSYDKTPSHHVHRFCGSSALAPAVTSAQLRAGDCTSVHTVGDSSLYWVPALYFLFKDGSVEMVDGGITTYYAANEQEELTFWPEDFRMVAGNPFRTSFEADSIEHETFELLCLGGSGKSNAWPTSGGCSGGLRAQFNFPQCWTGVPPPEGAAYDMAYPTDRPDGTKCPASHPVRLPKIFLEYMLGVDEWYKRRDEAMFPDQPFVWASGNREPYGLHGDFYFGWTDVLKAAFRDGTNSAAGSIDANGGGHLKLNDGAKKCRIQPIVNEQYEGRLPGLPGGNAIFDAQNPRQAPAPGPAPAPAPVSPAPAPTPASPAPASDDTPTIPPKDAQLGVLPDMTPLPIAGNATQTAEIKPSPSKQVLPIIDPLQANVDQDSPPSNGFSIASKPATPTPLALHEDTNSTVPLPPASRKPVAARPTAADLTGGARRLTWRLF